MKVWGKTFTQILDHSLTTSIVLCWILPLCLFPCPGQAQLPSDSLGLPSQCVQLVPKTRLPKRYAMLTNQPVPIFSKPLASLSYAAPVSFLWGGFIWVSLEAESPIERRPLEWYCVDPDAYILAKYLNFFEPSHFRGIEINQCRGRPMAWVILDTFLSTSPGRYNDPSGQMIKQYTLVNILKTRRVGQWNWYKIDDGSWIEQRRVALIKPQKRPASIGNNEQWIDIDLFEQTLTAYVGDRMVYATLISSGVDRYPTEQGIFRIWAKTRIDKMSGGVPGKDYYYLEDVPWQMYFYKNFAIHAAYWHDYFGIRQSHGCINVAPADARWLFDWTKPQAGKDNWTFSSKDTPGTWVRIHE